MNKKFYLLLIIILSVITADVISLYHSNLDSSIEKLKIFVEKTFEVVKTDISQSKILDIISLNEVDKNDLNAIRQYENKLIDQSQYIKIEKGGQRVAWFNEKEENSICRNFSTAKFKVEACINLFDSGGKLYPKIIQKARLSDRLIIDNESLGPSFYNFNLKKADAFRSAKANNIFLFLYFLCLLGLLFLALDKNGKFLLVLPFVIRLILTITSWRWRFSGSELITPIIDGSSYSIIELLVDSVLVYMVLITLGKWIKDKSKNIDLLFTVACSIFVSLLIVAHIRLIQLISFKSTIALHIDELSKINAKGIIVFICFLLLQAGIFQFLLHFISLLKKYGSKQSVYLSLFVCSVLSTVLSYIFKLDLQIGLIFLYFISFFILLDLFIDIKSKSITWIIWWSIFFGIYLSSLLFSYDIKRNINHKIKFLDTVTNDVSESMIQNEGNKTILKEINESVRELITLPSDAIYDKRDINAYLSKKHNKTIVFDVFNPVTEKSIFDEWDSSFPFKAYDGNFAFDDYNNILWYSHFVSDTASVHTGIELKPTQINNESFALIHNNKAVDGNLNLTTEELRLIVNNTDAYFFDNSNLYVKKNLDNGLIIASKQSFKSIIKPIALFSFIFSLITILILSIAFLANWVNIIQDTWPINLRNVESINTKIQISLILVTLLSFILIAVVTNVFLKSFVKSKNDSFQTEKLSVLSKDINEKINIANNGLEAYTIATNYEENLEGIHNVNLTFNSIHDNEFQEEYFPYVYFSKYPNSQAFSLTDKLSFKTSYLPLTLNNNVFGFAKITSNDKSSTELNVFDFLGSIFNVYVFLFLIASVLSVLIAQSITKPLSILNQKLRQLRLGKRNELIKWEREDEIGSLIYNYNTMVKELEDSAKLLAKTERDSAWREMAKQVAHEIKNPLTPMKMYIQHLEKAIKQKPDEAIPIARKISTTLLEQIENLTQIADSFSNFAELPQSSNEKVELNSVVEAVHNLFRKRDDMEIKLSEPIDPIFVFADKNQLIRILNNLVKNATEAIPKNKKGKIHLELFQNNEKAFIKVTDNGTGISKDMHDKVFQPKFTTKDSGSGLGLAIALNMIESMNGRLYFESQENIGTSFYIELDIIRQDFENQNKRIFLD